MTRLNLLGAQRVKALTEILERKYIDKIAEVRGERLSNVQAAEVYARQKGEAGTYYDALEFIGELEKLGRTLYDKLGIRVEAGLVYSDYSRPRNIKDELDAIIDNGTKERIKELKRELEEKKSQLWLVETLEQAQAIVKGDE